MADDENPWGNPAGPVAAPGKQSQNPWAEDISALDTDALIQKNPKLVGQLKNFMKFTGHGTMRGLSETFGFPADSFNALSEFVKNHPEAALGVASIPVIGAPAAAGGLATSAFNAFRSPKFPEAPAPKIPGGGGDIRGVLEGMGVPTKTPKEEGMRPEDPGYTAANWGDTLGEFGGANLPFIFAGPEKMAVQGATKVVPGIQRIMASPKPARELLKEIGLGGAAPGTAAVIGGEIFGEEDEATGKTLGAMAGNIRTGAVQAAWTKGKQGASWLHDFLGFGTGAESKVSDILGKSMQDPAAVRKELNRRVTTSQGAEIPVDIKTGDEGLLALRRQVMAKDAELAGDYRKMQQATEDAIKIDAKLKRPRGRKDFGSPEEARAWLQNQQDAIETLTNQRVSQAVDQAERDFETAVTGVERDKVDATLAKNRQATYLRRELLNARDDLQAVEKEAWSRVDHTMPVDMAPIYDDIHTMRVEHAKRPGQADERFPTEEFDRFFRRVKNEDRIVETPRFGVGTTLQELIDLDSGIQQKLRTEIAKDAPDRTYNAYLKRLSESINKVKFSLEPDLPLDVTWKSTVIPPLKEAVAMTKRVHDTFSRGPVGQVLGFDTAGGMDVLPGDTIKQFLSQGPKGVDAFNALMKAVEARTGQVGQVHPSADMPELLQKYVRQDFFDTAMASGSFNARAAEKWMSNNAGPLNAFPNLRQELTRAVQSEGDLAGVQQVAKGTLDDLRNSRAALFLEGQPGKLFNGALRGPDQYDAARKLVGMTATDPSGRATEGLAQMALDRMLADAIVVDKSSSKLERVNGLSISNWIEQNSGMINALNEEMPGIKNRFNRIAATGRYLERFQTNPHYPTSDESATGPWLRNVMAQVTGANIGRHFGEGGARIQTANIGSQAIKKLAAALTPDQASGLLRRALVDKDLFELLTQNVTAQNAPQQMQRLAPYFYSVGIPLMQPVLAPDGNHYLPDPNDPRKFMPVDHNPFAGAK